MFTEPVLCFLFSRSNNLFFKKVIKDQLKSTMATDRIFQDVLIFISSIHFMCYVIQANDLISFKFTIHQDVSKANLCCLDSPDISIPSTSKNKCALLCLQQKCCQRFNFRSDTQKCQLYISQFGSSFTSSDKNCIHYKVGDVMLVY